MSTRNPSALLGPEHLVACTDVTHIATLFRLLRYPVPQTMAPVPLTEARFANVPRTHIEPPYSLAAIGGDGNDRLSITLFVLQPTADRAATIRATTQAWVRAVAGQHLLVFACPDATKQFTQLVFVNPRRLTEGPQMRIKMHKLVVDRARPTRHDIVTLNALALLTPTITPTALFRQHCDAFDVEQVTKAFYTEYATLFGRVQERIKRDNPALPLASDAKRLRTFTQRLFGRLLFLYFLQKKGALNQEPDFITQWYEKAQQADQNFYRFVLEELFFNTLNKPRDNNRHPLFQHVPYLNGGLFAADDYDYRGSVYLDNAIFIAPDASGLLQFLDNHNFTVTEDTPSEVEVALDPEMMGKVLENLLAEDEREQHGTFYTPRPVVTFMCRQALATYLGRKLAAVSSEKIDWLLDEAETGEPTLDEHSRPCLNGQTLPRHQRDALTKALTEVRVLDPAVGSGAFLLGMLALLVGVRRALFRIGGAPLDAQSGIVAGWKWDFIRDCLYGVDIKQEAIEIARQRLWLSLVVEADPFKMEPLPNLDYKMMDGDSLIETFQGVEIIPTREREGQQQTTFAVTNAHAEIMDELRELQAQYFLPEKPAQRQALRAQIRATEQRLIDQILDERDADLSERLKMVLHKLNMIRSKPETAELTRQREAIVHAIAIHQDVRQAFRQGETFPFFLFRLYFGSIFTEQDGFDIIIANPPYVRHERIKPDTLRTLKTTYPDVQHGMADLYTYFYARALQLLQPNGTFAFITSNKFFRTGYGKGLLKLLRERTTLRALIDFGDAPVFDAAAYPCIIIADNAPPAADHRYGGFTTPPGFAYPNLDKLDETYNEEKLWMAQSAGVRPPANASDDLVSKLLSLGTSLDSYVKGKILYGIKTGLNEAFVIDQATHDRLIADDPRSAELLKPYLRGRDVSRYHLTDAGQWLIFTRQGTDIANYPAILEYLTPFREQLEPRPKDWPIEQKWPGRKPGPYQWYEIQDTIGYYAEFEKPKIISLRFGLKTGFVFDEKGYYCNDAIYTIATGEKWLTAVVNSSLCNLCLISISPSVQNGYSQFFVNKIGQLPIIEPGEADKKRLAEIVDAVQLLGGQGERAAALEREADAIIYKTYGLEPEEIAEIDTWHADRIQQLATPRNRSRQPRRDFSDDFTIPEAAMTPIPSTRDDRLPDHIDVAISFAGTERDFAEALAVRVRDAGFTPFYDQFYQHLTWGADLAVLFDEIYRKRARYCVMFVSQEYLARPWTNHERRSAIDHAIHHHSEGYILPIMVNETLEIPGIASSLIGHMSLRDMTINQIADILIDKLRSQP